MLRRRYRAQANTVVAGGILGGTALLVGLSWILVRGPEAKTAESASEVEGLRQSPKRIVTIGPSSAEILCALGVGDRIVGVSKFCLFPPELANRQRVGGLFDPDLERITALHPDLIVLRGRNPDVERLCGERGIAVFYDPTERLADIERCVELLARRVGRVERGADLIRLYRSRLAAIEQRVGGRVRPRVFLTVSRNPQELSNILTSGKGTFLDEAITLAGGVNIFGHVDMAYPQVSAEEILVRQPEVIIELMPEVELSESLEAKMRRQWIELGTTPATGSGAIHFITEENALIPSPRYVEIIERISRILHPDTGATKTE